MTTDGDNSIKNSKDAELDINTDVKFSVDDESIFEKAADMHHDPRLPDDVPEIKDWRYFWKRVLDDMRNKNLIPVKILFFFKYATLFVLYPFLTLQMRSLGLVESEIGLNQATIPVVAILGPPIAGIIADRIGNFKIVLAIITLTNSGLALLLLLVPVARETVTYPTNLTFELGCSPLYPSPFTLSVVDSSVCSFNPEMDFSKFGVLPPSEVQCGKVCPIGENENYKTIKPLQSIPAKVETDIIYMLPNSKFTFSPFASRKPDLICDGPKKECFIGIQDNIDSEEGHTSLYEADETTTGRPIPPVETINVSKPNLPQSATSEMIVKALKFTYGTDIVTSATGETSLNVTQPIFQILNDFRFNEKTYLEPSCKDAGNNVAASKNCTEKCLVQYERKMFCSNLRERKEYNVGLTFGLYTLFRILLGLTSATSFIMFEGAVLAILKQYGGDYGLQRVTATLAAVVDSPISGVLIYTYDFRPAFYLYAILQAVSAFLTLKIDLTFKQPEQRVLIYLKEVLSQIEILIFFFAMLCSGTAWGYLETFLFLYLKDLGGTEILMGLTISVGGLAGLPLLLFSRPIIKRMGHVNVLSLGLIVYCIRLFGYSIIENPWSCLIFEAMEAVTTSLAITAAATYAVALSSLQTIASIQGIMGGLYFGIGRGLGSLIGGFLIRAYGHRSTLQIFGIGALISGILYFIVNASYLRKYSTAHTGLDINNLDKKKGSSNANVVEAHNPALQFNAKDSGNGKVSNGRASPPNYDGGYMGPLDINKFTDIPLDEETSSNHKGKY